MIKHRRRGLGVHQAPRLRQRVVTAVSISVVAITALAGCSSSSPSSAPSSANTASSSPTTPGSKQSSSAGSTRPSTTASAKPRPQPSAGSTGATVPARTQATNKPVGMKQQSAAGGGVSGQIAGIRSAYVKAKLPGEVSGDSLVVTVELRNGSKSTLDLTSATVVLLDSKGAPANIISSTPAKAFPDSVAGGKSASGTFVFVVAKNRRDPVTIDVTISADRPVMVFKGSAD